MKIECGRERLKNAIILCSKIATRNQTLPILESILIESGDRSLIIKSTNLDIGVEIKIPARVERQGVTAVSGNILSGFLGGLSEGDNVKLDIVNNNLLISTKKNSTLIKSFLVEDFPIIPRIDKGAGNEKKISIDSEKFVSGLKSVVYASSISDMRPEISSVLVYKNNNDVIFVSTDSFRLAEKKINDVKNVPDDLYILLPYKSALEAIRIFDGVSEVLDIEYNKNQIFVSSPSLYFTSRIVSGNFPDYKQIIPEEVKSEAVVLKRDLIDSIKVSNIFSDKFNQINLKMIPTDSFFEISSKNQDKGESATRLAGTLEGDDVDIKINSKYILDCLPFVYGDSVHIVFNGNNRPVIIKGVGDDSFFYLVMPVSI